MWTSTREIGPHFITATAKTRVFQPDGKRILVNTGGYLFGGLDKKLVSFDLNGQDRRDTVQKQIRQPVGALARRQVAGLLRTAQRYVCAMPAPGQTIDLSADTKAIPVSQIAKDAGYNLHWSADNKKVHYTLGDEYFTIDLTNRFTFLPGAPDSLPPLPETGQKIGLTLKTDAAGRNLVFQNARIITMEGDRVIENGVLVVQNNKIVFVGTAARIIIATQPSKPKTQN
jgi:hypothetical protein